MIELSIAKQEIAKIHKAGLAYPPDKTAVDALARALAKHAKSPQHAAAVVDAWIENWVEWPKPAHLIEQCKSLADPDNPPKPIAKSDCQFCSGTGWEQREFTLKTGVFAGETVSCAVRCRCGGMPPTPNLYEDVR